MKNTRGVVIGGLAILAQRDLLPGAISSSSSSSPLRHRTQANLLQFTWPQPFVLLDNLQAGLGSTRLSDGHRLHQQLHPHRRQRRRAGHLSARWSPTSGSVAAGRLGSVVNILVLAGLIVPPAVVPTIWVLQKVGLFKTMPGLIFVEIAYGLPFCILLFRAFIASVPRELDEAAIVDGAGPVQIFFRVIFPVLRSVIMTVIILQSVFIYNDFQNPLYFLPGTAERHRPAHPAQLPEPVHHPVQPALRHHPAGHHPTVDHVHLLQPEDRRRDGGRLGQGLTAEADLSERG